MDLLVLVNVHIHTFPISHLVLESAGKAYFTVFGRDISVSVLKM